METKHTIQFVEWSPTSFKFMIDYQPPRSPQVCCVFELSELAVWPSSPRSMNYLRNEIRIYALDMEFN